MYTTNHTTLSYCLICLPGLWSNMLGNITVFKLINSTSKLPDINLKIPLKIKKEMEEGTRSEKGSWERREVEEKKLWAE